MYHIEILIAPKVKAYNFNLWSEIPLNDLPTEGAELYAEDCKFLINEVVMDKVSNTVVECRLSGAVEIHPDVHVIGFENELISKAIARLTDDWEFSTEYNIIGQQDLLDTMKFVRFL
jgi:hypothetical protein